MNLCIFRGNITRDAELKHLANGTAVLKFDLAVNYSYGKEEKTLFMKCTLFGKRAESLASYLLRGTNLLVQGMLTENQWTAQNGEVIRSFELLVDKLEFSGCKKSNNNQTNQYQQPAPPTIDIDEEAIPF